MDLNRELASTYLKWRWNTCLYFPLNCAWVHWSEILWVLCTTWAWTSAFLAELNKTRAARMPSQSSLYSSFRPSWPMSWHISPFHHLRHSPVAKEGRPVLEAASAIRDRWQTQVNKLSVYTIYSQEHTSDDLRACGCRCAGPGGRVPSRILVRRLPLACHGYTSRTWPARSNDGRRSPIGYRWSLTPRRRSP